MAVKPPTRHRPWAGGKNQEDVDIDASRLAGSTRSAASNQGISSHPDSQQLSLPGPNSRLSSALQQSGESDLSTKVQIPHDSASILPSEHPALSILGNSALVIQRQMEMMNLLVGFEQANKYIIMNGAGETVGYIAEQDHGIGNAMARQMSRTHRSFTTHIFDRNEKEVLRIHRPFAYINSRIRIYDPVPIEGYAESESSDALQNTSFGSAVDSTIATRISTLELKQMRIIGEAQQQWAPLRRKYNLFAHRPLPQTSTESKSPRLQSGDTPNSKVTALVEAGVPEQAIGSSMVQFAHVNEPFLSWDFTLRDSESRTVGSVNRNFSGFAREIFTDTGVYVLRMDSAVEAPDSDLLDDSATSSVTAMTLDQRAIMLATAVSIDFDYFSRHSHAGTGGFFPFPIWMGGSAPAEGAGAGAGAGAEAGATGTAGVIEGAAAGRGAAAGEGAIAGAGTMAGYEAMQRGVYGSQQSDDASPSSNEPFASEESNRPPDAQSRGDLWGEGQDPWNDSRDKGDRSDNFPSGGSDSGSSGDGGGGSWMDFFSD
ncbi:Scramblase-domain-containing protein [Polychaeton citri CBS 116435]|uniref:Scramblase-domain-containing protein n=1 Tax=Polychaeton citri CBS 116435 TaxID=1314669 RepID=A0A9P4Q300_9PEZI|nr:Scramblase-domain-containing protein [Polychaeton citri CBS 116435]